MGLERGGEGVEEDAGVRGAVEGRSEGAEALLA